MEWTKTGRIFAKDKGYGQPGFEPPIYGAYISSNGVILKRINSQGKPEGQGKDENENDYIGYGPNDNDWELIKVNASGQEAPNYNANLSQTLTYCGQMGTNGRYFYFHEFPPTGSGPGTGAWSFKMRNNLGEKDFIAFPDYLSEQFYNPAGGNADQTKIYFGTYYPQYASATFPSLIRLKQALVSQAKELTLQSITVWPNPSKGSFVIQSEGRIEPESISIFNAQGQILKSQRLNLKANGII